MNSMKNIRKKIALICLLCFSFLLTGCKIGNKEVIVSNTLNNRQVFRIGNVSCGLKEAKVYLVNYQNIYGTAYGLDLWQHDFGDSSLENYVKNITMQELAQVVCLDQLAKEKEMELSEEENGKIAQAAEEYFASLTEDETAYMGVSESDIKEYYEHYALAQKVYHSLTKAVNEEVSDDEARVMEIMQIFISDESRANEIASRLAQGEDFATLANNYNELSSIQVNVSRDELPDAVEQIAFQMENDEVSGKITVDGGFYFIKCLNKYNQELTEANKANIVDKREKEAFDDEYNGFVSSLSSNINEELWENLELETGSGMKTDTFFEVFNTYCNNNNKPAISHSPPKRPGDPNSDQPHPAPPATAPHHASPRKHPAVPQAMPDPKYPVSAPLPHTRSPGHSPHPGPLPSFPHPHGIPRTPGKAVKFHLINVPSYSYILSVIYLLTYIPY